jgi:hypothetical protein
MKRLIRHIAIHLMQATNTWVVSKELQYIVDEGDMGEATTKLKQAKEKWGNDPQIIAANISIAFRQL